MTIKNQDRRTFVRTVAGAALAAPILFSSHKALAGVKLAEDDPMAVALGYKEKTADVDAAKYPTHTKEQVCVDCVLYQGDDPEWGACGAFSNKLVAGQGWCQAYAAKPA